MDDFFWQVRRMCDIILGNRFGNKELEGLALYVGHDNRVLNADQLQDTMDRAENSPASTVQHGLPAIPTKLWVAELGRYFSGSVIKDMLDRLEKQAST